MAENAQPEIYPMPMFPSFQVRDVDASLDYYQNVLGFTVIFQMPDPTGKPFFAHVRRLKYQDILFNTWQAAADEQSLGAGVSITFAFSENPTADTSPIDRYAESIRAAGGHIIRGPYDTPYNTRELMVADPDGFRLVFTTPRLAEMRGFDETMERVRNQIFKKE